LNFELIRKSFDCRKKSARFVYVIDIKVPPHFINRSLLIPGSIESVEDPPNPSQIHPKSVGQSIITRPRVIIIGGGPCGLFCALALSRRGVGVTLFERGRGVESRGRDIGALQARRVLDKESNFCFGEGGAGTWSDGKLTTRIGKNSEPVRDVLRALIEFGAPENIMISGKPHLGTDRLVKILREMRSALKDRGVCIEFNTKVVDLLVDDAKGKCNGVKYEVRREDGVKEMKELEADAVVVATGHSANDVYKMLIQKGVEMEAKSSAMGFRIEHPQALINEAQYGVNQAHFAKVPLRKRGEDRDPLLPVADYRLAAHNAYVSPNGNDSYSCYSFCMCPGGQIVPTSVDENALCVNGMSFSTRSSKWANSGLVATVGTREYSAFQDSKGEISLAQAALLFQQSIETKAATMGGGDLVAPAQRVIDFLNRRVSEQSQLPETTYRPGIRSAPLHELYPPEMYQAFYNGLERFASQIPGYSGEHALLIGPESRTSSVVRVLRDSETLMAKGMASLFPAGEGAGFSGGIVSAAVDGIRIANSISKIYEVQQLT